MSLLADALTLLRPGVDFADRDGTLAGIRWDSLGAVPPTQAEVDAQIARLDVPQRVAAGDFVRALYDLGWLDAVKAAVAGAGGLVPEMWAHAASFERNHPLVAQIATAIGKTSTDLDTLFRKAATYS